MSTTPIPLQRPGFLLTGPRVLAVMVVTRLLTAVLWRLREWEMGDTYYYFTKIHDLPVKGMAATLTEYPIPVVWVLQLPQWTGETPLTYLSGHVLLMVGLDLAFCALLWARGGRHRGPAIVFWSLFLLALGPLMWLRFDILPAVLVGAAALFATTRPAVAGALLAAGASVKLWPASLLALLMHRRTRIPALGGFLVASAFLLVASVAAGGRERLFSPLTWQGDRGLQVESIWATPLVLARLGDDHTWTTGYSRWQAFEIFGPGVDTLLGVASIATLVGALACLALTWRVVRSPRPDGPALAAAMLAVVAIIILTNKTLSPQYVVWLAAPLAALVARVGMRGPTRRSVAPSAARGWAIELVLIATLSQAIFPFLYDSLIGIAPPDSPYRVPVAVCLALRNVLLVWLTIDTFRIAWRALGVRPTPVPVQRPARLPHREGDRPDADPSIA